MIDISSIQVFSDSDLLILYRSALAAVATGQSYQINGRQLTRADQHEIKDTIAWLEERINDANLGSNVALVQFGDETAGR
jgi:hypothetical protein